MINLYYIISYPTPLGVIKKIIGFCNNLWIIKIKNIGFNKDRDILIFKFVKYCRLKTVSLRRYTLTFGSIEEYLLPVLLVFYSFPQMH